MIEIPYICLATCRVGWFVTVFYEMERMNPQKQTFLAIRIIEFFYWWFEQLKKKYWEEEKKGTLLSKRAMA